MPAPLVGGALWAIGSVMGAFLVKLYDFLFKFVAEKWAYRTVFGTAFILAVAGLTVAMAGAVKAIVIGARIGMPGTLGASTYFLPSNINIIIAAYVSARLVVYVYKWTTANIERWFLAGI